MDDGELRETFSRAVRVLASWCGDLDVAERLAADATDRAAALPPEQQPPDRLGWCVGLARGSRPDLDGEPVLDVPELDPDGVPSGLDDHLTLLFVVCDGALTAEDRLVLALRVVCGLALPDVSRHLGLDEPSTRTRLARAQRRLTALTAGFAVPGAQERARRLPDVLDCVASMFTVAHRTSPEPPDALEELGAVALSLVDGLVDMHPGDPEVRGLRATLLLGLARRPGRVDEAGVALTLDEVDRSLWDTDMLTLGLADTAFALQGRGRFALEAAISAVHADAASVAATDWPQLVQLYEALGHVRASATVDVAGLTARTQLALHARPGTGEEAGDSLRAIEAELVELMGSAPRFARRDAAFAVADLRWRTGRRRESVATYRALLEHVTSVPVRRFCERRISQAG